MKLTYQKGRVVSSGLKMSEKLKFHGRDDKFWINKLRLYFVLHGMNLDLKSNNWYPCALCKYNNKPGCGRLRSNLSRWIINDDLTKIKETNGFINWSFCIEWIKNV